MSIHLSGRFTLHRIAAVIAVAVLPVTAFAWGSQAGDNGQQPIGADNDGPRQAIPNETSNHVPIETQIQHQIDGQGGTVYYVAPDGYSAAMYNCDRQPLALRADCRDAAAALYDLPRDSYVETYPGYMTYYYPEASAPVYSYRSYAATPEYYAAIPDYYVYSPYGVYSGSSTLNPTSRCIPAYGAGYDDCLHGTLQGH
ncbi:MAG TPA: hypothetical protein VL742_17210 [Casimicrobiaceae bacterium]|nr:hypothetical protein [Casimicrobiaceae bacterium]